MFDFFKSKPADVPLDAKTLREAILQLIKEELQKLDGGEGSSLGMLQLFVAPAPEQRFLYETALYIAQPEKLKEEIQRTADNYALDLPAGWELNIAFTDFLPLDSVKDEQICTGLKMSLAVAAPAARVAREAVLRVIKGKAAQSAYTIEAGNSRLNIGRDSQAAASDGSLRINHIAFPEDSAFPANQYISRQHAHIEWDALALCFVVYADEGGVPPRNKTKIRSATDETVHKLNSTLAGYRLKSGDQLILADAGVLEFTLI